MATETPQIPGNSRFKGKRSDLKWGKYDYPVTRTQKDTLDGLWYMMSGLPRTYNPEEARDPRGYTLPEGGFYSQRPDNGSVIIGLHHFSVTVNRWGRITSNEPRL